VPKTCNTNKIVFILTRGIKNYPDFFFKPEKPQICSGNCCSWRGVDVIPPSKAAGNLKDGMLCFTEGNKPAVMMLLKSFALDRVKEGGISI